MYLLQIKKRVSAVKEGIQQGIVDMEEDEDGHLNIKFKKEVMDRLKKEQDGSSQEIGQDWQEMSDEELGAHSLDKIDLEKMEEDLKKLSENGDGEELRKWFEEQEALLDVLGASQSEVSKVEEHFCLAAMILKGVRCGAVMGLKPCA